MKKVVAVILAAGESTRMKSKLTKLAHKILHKPMVKFVADACKKSGVGKTIVVVGHQASRIKEILGEEFEYVVQEKRLGTGHALMQTLPLLKEARGEVLVLPGDAPFIRGEVLKEMIEYHRKFKPAATVLTTILPDPGYYGRVIRDGYERIKKIVERKEASFRELRINEINSGIYCFNPKISFPFLSRLKPHASKGEYYLTDLIGILDREGYTVKAFQVKDPWVALGVNTPQDLKMAIELMKKKGKEEEFVRT